MSHFKALLILSLCCVCGTTARAEDGPDKPGKNGFGYFYVQSMIDHHDEAVAEDAAAQQKKLDDAQSANSFSYTTPSSIVGPGLFTSSNMQDRIDTCKKLTFDSKTYDLCVNAPAGQDFQCQIPDAANTYYVVENGTCVRRTDQSGAPGAFGPAKIPPTAAANSAAAAASAPQATQQTQGAQ